MQDAGYRMQDAGSKIEDTRYSGQESSEKLPKRGEKMDKTAQPTGVAIIGSKIGNRHAEGIAEIQGALLTFYALRFTFYASHSILKRLNYVKIRYRPLQLCKSIA